MSRKLLVGSLVLGASVLGAVFGLSKERPIWARSVSEFRVHPSFDRTVRVSGYLVPGTLCKMTDRCEHRFRISELRPEKPAVLPVRYQSCLVPDTFRDVPGVDISIIVEGKLCAGCHIFEAAQIMAKCPGKYEMSAGGGPVHGYYVPVKTCNARGQPSM